jgi:hypothetical protein
VNLEIAHEWMMFVIVGAGPTRAELAARPWYHLDGKAPSPSYRQPFELRRPLE